MQVSLREQPTLDAAQRAMMSQAYFPYLEFEPFDLRSLEMIEMVAEKVRAAYQRAKVRDLYDLHCFAATPFDAGVLRRLVVLKLWQVRDPFDPERLFERLEGGRYDWDDLRRLVRASERMEPEEILTTVTSRFSRLRELSELEHAVVSDAKGGWNVPLADRLREEIRLRFTSA